MSKHIILIISILIFISLTAIVGLSASNQDVVNELVKNNILAQESLDETTTVNGELDVNIQDYTGKLLFNRLCQATSNPYILSNDLVPNSYEINLTSVTSLNNGDTIGLFQDSDRPAAFFANIVAINGNSLTVDTPIDISYSTPNNHAVLFQLGCDLTVDGSSTPEIFNIDNQASTPIDIARMLIHITDGSSMDDGDFGGIDSLDKGIVLRKNNGDGTYLNYWNVKNNGDFGLLAYDKSYDDKASAGVYGLTVRLTFTKLGSVIRLEQGQSLEVLVQDDLTDLNSFDIIVEGHFTDEV